MNMITIDADLAGSKPLDLGLLKVMGTTNLSELMQSGILDAKEQDAVEFEYWRAVKQEADERAWEERVEREENEMIAKKIRDREKAIRLEEKRLLRNEAAQAKMERTLAETQRREMNAQEDMNLKEDAATEAHSKYEELEQAKEQIELNASEMKLKVEEEQRLWKVQFQEEARLEHEKKVAEREEKQAKKHALGKKQLDKAIEKQTKAKDEKKKVPLDEPMLIMLGVGFLLLEKKSPLLFWILNESLMPCLIFR